MTNTKQRSNDDTDASMSSVAYLGNKLL